MSDSTAAAAFQFPAEWEDDTRMNVLFGPFRPKSLDPVAWSSKMKFWEIFLQNYLLFHKQPCFSADSLKTAFIRRGKMPNCLQTVLDEAKRTGIIIECSEYIEAGKSTGLANWLVRFLVLSPLQRSLNFIKSPFVAKRDPEKITHVHVPVAKKLSEDICSKIASEHRAKLITMTELKAIAQVNNEEDLMILLTPLLAEQKAALTEDPPDLLIKFAKDEKEKAIINEIDRGVFRLEKSQHLLAQQIDLLEKDRNNAFKQVKSCLQNDNRPMAKSWLRRKKELEKCIEKRADTLENIRCFVDKLRQMETDAEVVNSYQVGVATLNQFMATNQLTLKNVESTMDEVQDVLDVTRDIEESLASIIDVGTLADLDVELAALLDEIPETPSGNPSGPEALPAIPHTPPNSDHHDLDKRLAALSF